jgi:tape measure domain-containing protein
MIVRELLIRLGVQVSPNIDKVPDRIQPIIDKSNEAGAAFRNMIAAFAGLSALKAIVNVADQMQSLQFRIGELPQTVSTAAQAFDTVAAHAIEARQSVAQYAQLYVRVGGATKNFLTTQEDVLAVTDAISKALVVGGASALEQKSAIEQLSQGFQAGKFQGNDFKIAMAALSTDIREKLATAMGYTLENLKKMSSEGKITAEMLARAFIKIGPDVAYSFRKVPMTIGQAFTIIQGKFAVFINRLNRESSAITNVATFFVNTFSTVEKALNSLVDSLDGGGQAIKIFGLLLATALAPTAIKLFVGAISTIFSPMTLVILAMFTAALALEDLYTWFQGGDSIIGRWIGSLKNAEGQTDRFKAALAGLAVALGVITFIAPIATLNVLIGLFNGLAAAIFINIVRLEMEIALYVRLAAIWVAETIPLIWAQVTAWTAASLAALGVTLPLWAIIAIIALIALAVYVLYKVFTGQFGDISKFISDVWDGVLNGFRAMVDGLMSYWQKFKSFWGIGASTSLSVNGTSSNVAAPATPNTMQYPTPQGSNNSTIVNINQTLPPGSTPEVATAARDATAQAADSFAADSLTRRMAQYGAS